jgi:hypothetical protein
LPATRLPFFGCRRHVAGFDARNIAVHVTRLRVFVRVNDNRLDDFGPRRDDDRLRFGCRGRRRGRSGPK